MVLNRKFLETALSDNVLLEPNQSPHKYNNSSKINVSFNNAKGMN